MTIIPAQSTIERLDSAVRLPRYAKLIEFKECAFFGVDNPDDPQPGCENILTKMQRDDMQKYLLEAQDEIEQIIRYPLHPKWFTDEVHHYSFPLQADWGRVIIGGVKATTDISLGEAVNHAADPAVVGPVATTVIDENEIIVYHPGTDVEIIPSEVSISGGNVTINIPRCRMVLASLADNPEEGLAYSNTANFEQTVDIKRVYNDPSTNAELVWPHRCGASCSESGCSEFTQDGCEYIRNPKLGMIDVLPATYSNNTWTQSVATCCSGQPELVRLNYKAGLTTLTPQAEDAIVRLAHSKMPDEICGCETWSRLWRRDRNVPGVLTRERLNCPFGINDGAWIAWQFTQRLNLVRGYVL